MRELPARAGELDILGSRNALPEDFREAIRMLESGHFSVDAMISATVLLGEAPAWLKRWDETPGDAARALKKMDDWMANNCEGIYD